EAFPWNEAPRYLIRDQDRAYGIAVTRRLRAMGIRDKPIAPGSPWQNAFAKRLIGSIGREFIDHVVVLAQAHLRPILQSYERYYNTVRTHRSLNKDAPVSRPVQRIGHIIPACGDIDSCAHAPCQSKTPISHWTAGRFCDGCLGGGAGSMSQGLRVLVLYLMRYWADFITCTSECEFSVHTPYPSQAISDRLSNPRSRACGHRRQGALPRECLQVVAHDGASRRAASDFLEASARERRGCANENIRRALRYARVDRISLERRCLRTLCGLHGRGDKLSHDSLPAIVPAHEETGDRPDGQIVHTLEPPHAVKPRECIARRELAPAHWQIAVESEQTRRGAAPHDLS